MHNMQKETSILLKEDLLPQRIIEIVDIYPEVGQFKWLLLKLSIDNINDRCEMSILQDIISSLFIRKNSVYLYFFFFWENLVSK